MATRLTMRTNARIRADQDNSTFPTDAQYNMFIDKGAAHAWRKLVRAGWKPDRTTVTISPNGASAYNVGTDVSVVLSVDRVDSASARAPLPRVKPEDLNGLLIQGNGPALAYDLIGGALAALQIELYPRPTSGSIEVRYIKRFPGFTADGDNWYGPDGSDELIEIAAATMGIQKEGGDVRELKAEWVEKYIEICEMAGWLDAKGQQTVRDVRDEVKADSFDWNASEGW